MFPTPHPSEWINRIKLRMKDLGMTQEELASKMGITRSAISHYLAGRRMPPLTQFTRMADILKTNPAWLQFGKVETWDVDSKTIKNISLENLPTLYPIPILSWNQLNELSDIKKLDREKVTEWVRHLYSDELNCVALRIIGDSMIAASSHMKSFREGDIVQFDTARIVKPGDYVIAILPNAKEATFKQYVEDGGKKYLKPLNQQYPIIPIDDNTRICGVMICHFAREE